MMPSDTNATPLQGEVAIVGMGCLFAGAPNLDAYWQNILGKVDAVSDPPAGEWDPKIFYDPASKSNDRVYCKKGGYIGDLSQFKPTDFGIMPVTVDGGEPDQWLALRVAQEALADAGYPEAPKEHERTEVILGKGTYVNRGNLTVGYHGMIIEYFLQALRSLHPEYTDLEIDEIKKELKSNLPPFSSDTAPALIGNIIAGRIANRLDLMGPSFTVDAACASALLAIEIGVRDLLTRKCDLVLAGGANVNAPLPTMSLFCQLGALSHQEQIRPFDKNADGTILGEGIGMVVLKRLDDALRDGSRIYAVIKGVGIASDGRALHVMAPRVEGEELALRRAFAMAGIEPDTIGLIEAHGTATPVGDVVELQALRRVFGERNGLLPKCAIGSVKSMIGHTMPAAGIAGVIKSALSLYHGVLPPTLNCEEPNPALKLDQSPFYVNTSVRPWIHGADTPRRAGVNSFGFGGINGHVVLEEPPDEYGVKPNHQLLWETELCVLAAETREALLERGARLQNFLQRAGDTPLKDIAYSLNSSLGSEPARLSILATSNQDLEQKLSNALTKLADPKCRQIKDQAGIYYFAQPLEGKLAFLFPGEGAQYPNMLLDLCVHFPEVRRCFDLADRALAHGSRSFPPSEFIFPRTILSESERTTVDKALWEIDGAVEAVLIGNWAMRTLLEQLGIRPDVIVGHSTGDYSAMLASSIIDLPDAAYVETILDWNKAHSRLAEAAPVAEVTLVAAATDKATLLSVIEETGGELYLAMDNCPHQAVLLGSKKDAEIAIEHLRRRGVIYEVLPFDRPYHTPMFQAYAEGAGDEFFARLPISAPKIETYSCTSAAPYPSDVAEIRDLFVAHWVKPVLFTETVTKMYDDGVRLFVEAGPRGNLTAFVSDILRGKPHLAMPANVARRSGITQLHHLLGALAAQNVGMRLDYLYARRQPQRVAWESPAPAIPAKRPPVPMNLPLALPPLKLSPRPPKPRPAVRQEPEVTRVSTNGHTPIPVPAPVWKETPQPQPAAQATATARVVQDYLKGMESFLETETQVMTAFLNRQRGAEPQRSAAPAPTANKYPLLGEVTSIVPGQRLVAERTLTREEDLFLSDHALGRTVSITDPDLRALVVVPLTMSMEMLAQAAAALIPGQVLVEMRAIQAYQWIRVADAPVRLQITAVRNAEEPAQVSVEVRSLADSPGQKLIEGIMVFGPQYPAAPPLVEVPLKNERASRLDSSQLYGGRMMFHGPCFQGVEAIGNSGQNGIVGKLRVLPGGSLFRGTPNPAFVTDPVVLDAAGQLVGFWAAEYLERGFVVFPFQLQSLKIYGPNRPADERLTCRVNLELQGEQSMRSDLTIRAADGTVWMTLTGWADRRFDPPKRFHEAWTEPGRSMMSDLWPAPVAGISNSAEFMCRRLDPLFAPGAPLWKELWASLILTRSERDAFATRRGPEQRQMEWLAGRTAAKDAVRSFLRTNYDLELLPADIEIAQDENGRPHATGAWLQLVPAAPEISVTHSEGVAAALVTGGENGRRVGIDLQAIRELKPDFLNLAFNSEEQRLLHGLDPASQAEWVLRLWSAKEAISKALGYGLIEGPASVRIVSVNPQSGVASGIPHGKLAMAVPEASGREIAAYTTRQGGLVTAAAIFEKRTQ